MFVSKIGNEFKKQQVFKGYQHEVNNVGSRVMRFNYPFDYNNESCKIDFYNVKEDPSSPTGYRVVGDKVKTIELKKDGVVVNPYQIKGLNAKEMFAYKLNYSGNANAVDTGINQDGFNLVTTRGTAPTVQGSAILSMPDLHRPGAYYDKKTGKVLYDIEKQKASEKIIRNFSNAMGGSLAGYEYELDALDRNDTPQMLSGVKVLFSTPIAGGDNRSAFRYWNKNNLQMDSGMGTAENYENFTKKMFKHGKKLVYDGTFTSEGLEGIHFQYALRWAGKDPQTQYWFKMTGINDEPIGLGVIPEHSENLRHKVINAPTVYNSDKNTVEINPKYNSAKETYIQIYDAAQVTEEQATDLTKPIDRYANLSSGSPLDINTHDDTVMSYIFEINPNEYTKRLEELSKHNKTSEHKISLNTPEGTEFIGQFSSFKFTPKRPGGSVTWDANTDMQKMSYSVSPYDEKILEEISAPSKKEYATKMTQIGTYETKDLALQAARYWTAKSRIIQTLYAAQALQANTIQQAINEVTAENETNKKGMTPDEIKATAIERVIDKLIQQKELPEEAKLSNDAILNILDNYYKLETKGVVEKDDVTIKALMQLPLDSLELGENTQGVLSSSYFSNRATSPETVGLTRFELLEQANPHLLEKYADNYMKTSDFYETTLKEFADKVLKEVDSTSEEKLFDSDGNYTPYGEYVTELMGQDIAKYALLKAFGGKNTEAWYFEDGTITYDYDKIKENTTLKSLGINASNPADEAAALRRIMEHGVKTLKDNDVQFVAKSISQRIQGTNLDSFKLSEAIVGKAGLGLDFRLDAAKDIMDWDAVRNGDLSFDEAWDKTIEFWAKYVQAVKKENPNAYIVAEITDIESLMKKLLGDKLNLYGQSVSIGNKYKNINEAMQQFFIRTGVTSEAAYSYTFTNLLRVFSHDFEEGHTGSLASFINNYRQVLSVHGIDYVRNLWTFADNHDKPSVIHGMALDMPLFLADLETTDWARETAMRMLMNADDLKSLPLEAKFFLHNMDYYRNVSMKAVAMSKLMRDCTNDLNISDKEKHYMKCAIANLTSGNYLGEGATFPLAFENTEALASLDGALKEIAKKSNITLSNDEFSRIINHANSLIDGFFANKAPNSKENLDRAKAILSNNGSADGCAETDLSQYSVYSVAIMGALREALHAQIDNDRAVKTWDAQRDYIKQYNNEFIKKSFANLPTEENSKFTARKDAYAARDFETVIKMIITEAENLAKQDNALQENEHFNKDEILKQLFIKTTEPAIDKAVRYMSFLSALPGIPSIYARDMLGALGFDEKTKNIFLQNRNAIVWSELEEGPLKEYRQKIFDMFKEAIQIRTDAGEALDHGTPYLLETSLGIDVPAILMQDGKGNMTVSVLNAKGNEADDKLDYILLSAAGLSLPLGLEFINSAAKDKATYIVKEIAGKGRAIAVKEGSYIALNKDTLRNGVMVLKHVAFRGNSRQINKQYNIVTNPYKKTEPAQEGQKLSIIAG